MFRVYYHNYEDERIRDFEELEDAIAYAEAKYLLGWLVSQVVDEYENIIVEYEN